MSMGTPRVIKRVKSQEIDHLVLTITYQVDRTSVSDDETTAETAVEALPLPPGYFIQRMETELIAKTCFNVVVTLQTPPWDAIVPWDRAGILSTTYEESTEPYFTDRYGIVVTVDAETGERTFTPGGAPVVTSSHERFENFPTRRSGKLILQWVKNYQTLPVLQYDAMKHMTNNEGVTIKGIVYPARSLLLLPIVSQETVEQVWNTKYTYFVVTFRFLVDIKDLHTDKIEDRGYFELDGAGKPTRLVMEKGEEPPTAPLPLDGTGKACRVGGTFGSEGSGALDPAAMPFVFTFYPYENAADWGITFD